MIKYNYTIKRLKEDREFKPVKQYIDLNNYSVIRGKNAIGKSTLLHLLAYSFFGYDQRSYESKYHQINKILSDKIKQFNEKDEQTLYSNFEITLEGSDIRLCSEKNEGDDFPKVYELNKEDKRTPLAYEKFAQKYCLIYDIPDKPTDRISNLVEDVKIINQRLIDRIDKFSEHLEMVNSDISNSKDPKKIESLKSKIAELETTLDPLRNNKGEVADLLKLLELLISKNKYLELSKKIQEKEGKIEELKQKKTFDSKEIKKRESLIKQIRNSYSNFRNSYGLVVQKSAQMTTIYEADQFKRLKENTNIISLTNWEWSSDVLELIRDYSIFLKNKYEKYKSDHKVANIYEQLLDLLKELDRNGETLPKVKLPDLIQGVKDMVGQHTQQKNIAEGIMEITLLINQADSHLEEFINSIEDFGEGCSALYEYSESDTMLDYTPKIRELKREIEELDLSKKGHGKNLIQLGVEINDEANIADQIWNMYPNTYKKYCNITLIMLEDLLKSKKANDCELDKKIEDNEFEMRLAKKQLDEIKKMDIHPLYNKSAVIHDLYNKMLSLKSDISQYNKYFDILSENHNSGVSEKIAFYNSKISKYFAKKLGKIPYIDAHVDVLEVDYLNRQFVLAGSDIVVKFDYFSTGQAQCIYIMSLLNQNMDRKVILLLDEISSMDEETLKLIHNEIRAKRATGQLLVALLAEKSNLEPSVEVL